MIGLAVILLAVAVLAGLFTWRSVIWRTTLDPHEPFPTHRPPPAPDYAEGRSWALRPAAGRLPAADAPPADVFFIHPSLYPGGREWNAPIDEPQTLRRLARAVLPNLAGPFQRVGRVWAPRYRAASLFAYLTLRDDARDARQFPYRDIRAAFDAMLAADAPGRPILIVGVGQGGLLALRLLQERVLHDPAVLKRVAAAYLIDAVTPLSALPAEGPLSPCRMRAEAGCVVGWTATPDDDAGRGERRLERALTWTADGRLENLRPGPILCVDPLTGGTDAPSASARANQGAADATGLEWGARPAFLAHQVSARCEGGLLRVSRPEAPSLQPRSGWLTGLRTSRVNLFYADEEADARARLDAWAGRDLFAPPAPPLSPATAVRRPATHAID